ncbi:hypothetical protein BDV97DRAFT_399409 [Delphinella strobiligena]|nr:hypothetical protein BDV97DRAFT_399409 [Delphinella strobiligena]
MAPRSTVLPSAQTESARELRNKFYCEMCSKGYARINEFEAHENSYDHQHRKRLKEMKALTRNPTAAVRDNRAERKRKENSDMISMNLQTEPGVRPSNATGFKDATQVRGTIVGTPDVGKGVPSDSQRKEAQKEQEQQQKIMRPPTWDELDDFYTLVDAAALPEQMQDKVTPLPWGQIWGDKDEMDQFLDAVDRETDSLEGGEARKELGRAWDDMSEGSDFDDLDSEMVA